LACGGRIRWPWSRPASARCDAEHARERTTPAGAGQQAELDLGLAELDLRVVDDDPAVAGQRDLQAADPGPRR
jgi:hypothetical protein